MSFFSSLKKQDSDLFLLLYVKQQWLQSSLILRKAIKFFFKFCQISRKQIYPKYSEMLMLGNQICETVEPSTG